MYEGYEKEHEKLIFISIFIYVNLSPDYIKSIFFDKFNQITITHGVT